jgi:sulfoxide reductase heme-binding subunit YedZ
MRHDPTFWLLARAFGLTAYVMLTLSVLVGLMLRARPFRSLKPAAVTDLHRVLALLGLTALAGHGAALVLDSTVRVTVPALFVPGLIAYRPVWTSMGVLAAETMVIVYASFSLRKRIGSRNWRRLHWATYGIFAAATIHGLAAGSDSSRPWAFAVYLGAIGSVAGATAWRVLVPPARARPRRPAVRRLEHGA